jgi:hypothetical protein
MVGSDFFASLQGAVRMVITDDKFPGVKFYSLALYLDALQEKRTTDGESV